MALSGSFTASCTYGNATINWSATQNIATKTSTIAITMKIVGVMVSPQQTTTTLQGTVLKAYINGSSDTTTIYQQITPAVAQLSTIMPVTIGPMYIDIPHDENGEAIFDLVFNAAIGGYMANNRASFVLDPIHGAASVSSTSGYIGDQVTVTVNSPSTSFTYTLTYKFGSATGTIATKTSSTSIKWTLPSSFYNQLTSSKSGVGTITCETFSDSTSIGTSTCQFTATVKEGDVKPAFNPSIYDSNSVTTALTGNSAYFVRYFSNATYAINASGRYGATIVQQAISCGNDIRYTATGVFNKVESAQFVVSATDSRGIINSEVINKFFVPYVKLTCNLSTDTADTNGNYNFAITGNYFKGNFGKVDNTLSVQYRYKEQDGTYTNWITPGSITYTQTGDRATDVTYNANVAITGLDYQKSYIFQTRAVDKLMTVESPERVVRSKPVFDWSGEDFNFNVPVIYTDTATGNRYSISDAAKAMAATAIAITDDDYYAKVNGMLNAMSKRYELPCEVYPSLYYSSVSVSLYLYGNTIRGYMSAVRNEAVASAGNVANELVCQVEFDSGFKVTGFGQVVFTSGTEGGMANFQMTDTLIYPNDGSVSEEAVGKGVFSIRLCSVGTVGDRWNAYFSFPCLLDLTKF